MNDLEDRDRRRWRQLVAAANIRAEDLSPDARDVLEWLATLDNLKVAGITEILKATARAGQAMPAAARGARRRRDAGPDWVGNSGP